MKKNNRFAKGSGVYTCQYCGKRTRETGSGESYAHMCLACWEDGGQENCHSDDNHPGKFEECPICERALGRKPMVRKV
jgi:hypothetical protein